ncbi:MAG: PAS domain S-box protein, partial [Gemmataceae bacterium]
LMASIDGIVWEADADTFQFTFVSEQAERLLGYPVRDWLIPTFWADHVHPDDRGWAVQFCRQATRERRPHDFEYRMLAADGRVVWLRDIVTVAADTGERPRIRGVMVDVTAKKRAEEEWQVHVRFLESLDRVNRALQGATELEAMMRDVLDVVLALFGCDRAWLVYPCDADAAAWRAVMERTRPEYPGALQLGLEIPIDVEVAQLFRTVGGAGGPVCFGAGSPLPLPGGLVAQFGIRSQICTTVYPKVDRPYIFGLHQCSHPRVWSASEQRLFQEIGRRLADALTTLLMSRRMRDSEARFRLLVDHATDAFFLHAADGTVLDVNRQACDSLGYTRDELVGLTPTAFDVDVAADALGRFAARLTAGETITLDTRHRRKDGTLFPVEVRIRAFREGGKRLAVSLARDVSDRKRLEEQFRQSQKMEAVGRLAGGVAHDFNNLLTVINGYSGLVLAGLPADDPSREPVAEIQRAGVRAGKLTRQLLAFSRSQLLQPDVVSLNALLGELHTLLRRLIGADVELTLGLDPAAGCARVDPGQFEQAVVNLAVNARDAMPDGGRLTVETHGVELTAPSHPEVRPGRYVLVTVSDTGHGMDAATMARIFEPFFTTKERGKGTGLGLAMVYGFVKQSGGHVEVDSEVGRGTTFRVYLPHTEAAGGTAESPARPVPASGGTETVLLVEDEESVRDLVRIILRSNGYTVLEARDGQDGLDVARRLAGRIDLLVTDLVMPRLSGRRLAEQLTTARPGLRVLFLSGYAEDEAGPPIARGPDVAFLQKPFTPASLARKVREVLDAAGW